MIRLPFFGLLANHTPMHGILDHYHQIARGMELIEDSMACYIGYGESSAQCKDFQTLIEEVDGVEERADQIKRYIRNHTPSGLVLPVDRVLFFNYTRLQDNILDSGQDSLYWLSMRQVSIPADFQRELVFYLSEVGKTIKLLKPALESAVAMLTGETIDRQEAKQHFRAVRMQHKLVNQRQNDLLPQIFNSDMDFKEIYQLIHYVQRLHDMSHCAEGCADMLRAMLAK